MPTLLYTKLQTLPYWDTLYTCTRYDDLGDNKQYLRVDSFTEISRIAKIDPF